MSSNTHPHSSLLCALASLLALAPHARAQDSTEQSGLTVTGSRLSSPPAASSTTVRAADIEPQHAADAAELLGRTPSVYVASGSGPGAISEVFLRGAESNFAVVLVDGVRRNDASNTRGGGYDFSTIDPNEIERIEILRGPLSAVYGSDAMAGAINIITRAPTSTPSARASVETSDESDQRAFLSIAGPLGARLVGSAHAVYSDVGENSEGSTRRLAGAELQGAYTSDPLDVRMGARFAKRHRTAFPDASGSERYAVNRELERADADEASAWLNATHRLRSNWDLHFQGTYFDRDEDIDTPAVAPGVFDAVPASVSHTHYREKQFTVYARGDVVRDVQLSAGADILKEDATRTATLDLGFAQLPSDFSLDRRTLAAFAEVSARPFDSLALYGSARLDDSDRDRTRTSARLSSEYALRSIDASVRLTWANGHKAPSFYSLGDSLVGNPDLQVERSDTWEASFEKNIVSNFSAGITAFQSRYSNLIDFDFATFKLINRSRVDIDGVEMFVNYRPLDTLSISARWTESSFDMQDDAQLLYRPKSYGGLSFNWHFDARWDLFADARFVGSRHGSSVPTGDRDLDAYRRLDVSITRNLNSRAKLYFNLDNALDNDYQETVGFRSPGMQARVGINVTL
ncbi:MAG TPA: TonB-dependent receptor [Steroidobacteraceae bacterium]|nr:TonB-dependent receptor [Steroidobacteraceae bacterium]